MASETNPYLDFSQDEQLIAEFDPAVNSDNRVLMNLVRMTRIVRCLSD